MQTPHGHSDTYRYTTPKRYLSRSQSFTYIIEPNSGDFFVEIKNLHNLVSATIQGLPNGSVENIERQSDGDLRYEIAANHGFNHFRVVIENENYDLSEFQLTAHTDFISEPIIES